MLTCACVGDSTIYTSTTLTAGATTAQGAIFGANYIIGGARPPALSQHASNPNTWMLSGVRISQARVKQVPCEDLPSFADASQFVCNGHNSDWDTDDEEKGAFGAGPRKFEWAGWPELNSSRSALYKPLHEEREMLLSWVVTKLHNQYAPQSGVG